VVAVWSRLARYVVRPAAEFFAKVRLPNGAVIAMEGPASRNVTDPLLPPDCWPDTVVETVHDPNEFTSIWDPLGGVEP
jgi:hypothetical protein